MAVGSDVVNWERLQRFNRGFPPFYEQLVSSSTQRHNLRLAYQLYKSKHAVIETHGEGSKTALYFASRNRSFLLSDLFGIIASYRMTVHSLSLHGQVRSPMLVFIKLVLSQGESALSYQTIERIEQGIRVALAEPLAIEGLLRTKFPQPINWGQVTAKFYVDPILHLPALSIEAQLQTVEHRSIFYYEVTYAIWQEDLLVVNAELINWRQRTRVILYLFGPDETPIPEQLGHRIAESVKQRVQLANANRL